MAQSKLTRADDLRHLKILDVVANEGNRAARERFSVSNGAIQSLVSRTNARRPDRCKWQCEAAKPENKDGGMKRRWWANGE